MQQRMQVKELLMLLIGLAVRRMLMTLLRAVH